MGEDAGQRDPARPRPLGRAELEAGALWDRFPPKLSHEGKKLVFELSGGLARRPSGVVHVARYTADGLPAAFPARAPELCTSDVAFSYPEPEAGTTEWHVNFANTYLFCAYGAAAFAQDEIQVAEHPILGSVLEALTAEKRPGLAPLTVDAGAPTPVLIRGAERWCAIDTAPELASPYGIYGQRFRKARPEVLRQAVTRLDAGPRTNLIAMEAPMGAGEYTRAQLEGILATAWTGFAAARSESPAATRLVVHTGHWGTGAYGGHRVVMAVAQVLAAHLAQVDRLVYHSIGDDGLDAYEEGRELAARLARASSKPADAIDALLALGFQWGASDGN